MTIANYVQAAYELRFDIVNLRRHIVPIDVAFYLRFEEVLGRYPALDLETDFATLILERPVDGEEHRFAQLPELGYLEAQRKLSEAVAAHRSGT